MSISCSLVAPGRKPGVVSENSGGGGARTSWLRTIEQGEPQRIQDINHGWTRMDTNFYGTKQKSADAVKSVKRLNKLNELHQGRTQGNAEGRQGAKRIRQKNGGKNISPQRTEKLL